MSEPADGNAVDRTVESIQAAITQVVIDRGWGLTQLPDQLIWSLELQGERSYTCYIQIEPLEGQAIFYGVLPHTVAEDARTEAAVAVAAVNYGLAVGKFELDLTDGELRFSNGIDVTGTVLDPVVFARMADHTIEMLDAYTPTLSNRVPLPDLG
ncbi:MULTISPECIES: YbjN domain-containing protein [unclassified Nocardioides]|uniref:YbjN domain-containing protein n=1 Tax=unclassified Nocardioides TaxID=2615069 RepID=UPI00301422A1